MSIHLGTNNQINVETLLLKALAQEESNVIAADKELQHCLAAVQHHQERLQRLRAAIQALQGEVEK